MLGNKERGEAVQRAWSTQRWDAWLATCADDYVFHPSSELALDRDQTMAWNRACFAAFPDYTEHIEHIHVDGDCVVTELIGRGTSRADFVLFGRTLMPKSGRSFHLRYAKVLVFNADGLVTRDRQYQDWLSVYRQVGILDR